MTIDIAWGGKVELSFVERVLLMCHDFDWYNDAPSDVMSCIAFESGETFSPNIRNAAGSGATGLIQFMPATAEDLGTTVELLSKMYATEQLDYVEKYFDRYASRIHSLSDMYMAILLPKYVGTPDSSVLFTEGGVSYRQNSGLDSNHDGKITKAEATAKVMAKKEKGLKPGYVLRGV
jgi:hypothetical protein